MVCANKILIRLLTSTHMYTKIRREVENSVGETDNKHTHAHTQQFYLCLKQNLL